MRSLLLFLILSSSFTLACNEQPTGQNTVLKSAYIALDDNGASGPALGCGDSEVLVEESFPEALDEKDRIQKALQNLFADKEQFKKDSGLYNALYQSTLSVEAITITAETITVELSGTVQSGGVCDDPRIVTQITDTIKNNLEKQPSTHFIIHLNGAPLENLQNLSGQ